MSSSLTAAEVEQQYTAAMGPELGKVFNRLWNECACLHVKWNQFAKYFDYVSRWHEKRPGNQSLKHPQAPRRKPRTRI